MNFIKRVLSTIVGIFIFCVIGFFLFFLIALAAGSSDKDKVVVKNNSVLELDLSGSIPDYEGKFDYGEFSGLFSSGNKKTGLFNIIDAIKYAKTDDKIKGITITNSTLATGLAQTKALRDALLDFKESEKFIYSYADVASQTNYYLTSVSDSIYLNPVGAIDFKGLATEILYFKDFQEKYGMKMEVIRHGKYKSAVEPFLAQEMSDANREQTQTFLNSIWITMKEEISKSRNISVDQLDEIATKLNARNASKSLENKLIDKVAYIDEFKASIKEQLDVESDKDYNTISIEKYTKKALAKLRVNSAKNKIAVIYAQGQIIYGEGDETMIGQGSINKAIKEAREDDKIKAIVLRVDSPGGSALASELIWREIELTKNIKPVFVSMGNLAASGGYYIACNADKIISEPTTITGSIGVFGTLPNLHEFMNDLGINAEQVETNEHSVDYSVFEPFDDETHDIIKEGVVDIYKLFTKRVADGRKMSVEQVNEIAQGRVWSGNDAIKIGLVDEIGGLDLAIQRAAEAAELSEYKLKSYPVYEKDIMKQLESFGLVQSKESIIKSELGEKNYEIYNQMKKMKDLEGVQALLPYDIIIK